MLRCESSCIKKNEVENLTKNEKLLDLKDRKFALLFGIGMMALYSLRFLLLDADVKNWTLGQIYPVDEFYYNEIALMINRYGLVRTLDGAILTDVISNSKTFVLPNLLTALSMKVFGNNFYGLKIPYIVMGAVIAILLFCIARRMFADQKIIILLVMISFVFDFNVFMLSREAVTVIPCMLACTLFAYGILVIQKDESRLFFIGFWAVISFCMVYMSTVFLVVTSLLYTVVLLCTRKQNRGKKAVYYLAGVVTATILSDLSSLILFRQHIYKTVLDVIFAHRGKFGEIPYIYRLPHYWGSNVFQYNYLLLVLGVCAFLLCMYAIVVERDNVALIMWMLVGSHWAQTFFLDNMTDSKAAFTFPILLIMVPYTFTKYGKIWAEGKKGKKIGYFVFGLIAVLALIFNTLLLIFRKVGMEKQDKYFLIIVDVLVFFLLFLWLFSLKRRWIYIGFCITMMFMSYASVKYVLWNPTYTFRDNMVDIGETTENGAVINGIGLYNQCIMPASIFDKYRGVGYDYDTMYAGMLDAVEQYDTLYYLGKTDLENEWSITKLNKLLEGSSYQFVPVKTYSNEWWAHKPHDEDWILYVKTKKR